MAGRGPRPKDKAKRARSNSDPVPTTTLRNDGPAKPPALPSEIARMKGVRRFWDTWKQSPQAETFGATDWLFLLDTAYLVAQFYEGDFKLAAEIRLRLGKLGATAEDRARLRYEWAERGDQDDHQDDDQPTGARERYGDLRVVGGTAAPDG